MLGGSEAGMRNKEMVGRWEAVKVGESMNRLHLRQTDLGRSRKKIRDL